MKTSILLTSLIQILCFLISDAAAKKSTNNSTVTDDFDETELERQAFASIQEDIHLADLETNKAEALVVEGNRAVALTKQDEANENVDEINALKDTKLGTKPRLGNNKDLAKEDLKFREGDHQTASENRDTAKEDRETGAEDRNNGLEDKKKWDGFKQSFGKVF